MAAKRKLAERDASGPPSALMPRAGRCRDPKRIRFIAQWAADVLMWILRTCIHS